MIKAHIDENITDKVELAKEAIADTTHQKRILYNENTINTIGAIGGYKGHDHNTRSYN